MVPPPPPDLSLYDGRSVLSGRMGGTSMWVDLAWEGQDPDAPLTLPDGRDASDVIASGDFRQIADQTWLEVTHAGKPTDMLWSTGMAITVVSQRMADALVAAGAEEFDVFPVTVRRRRSPDMENYVVLVCNGHGEARPVREFPLGRRATPWLDVRADVLAEVSRRGCTGFDVEDARRRAEDMAADQSVMAQDLVCRDPRLWSSAAERGDRGLRLTIDSSIDESMFAVPADAFPTTAATRNLTENSDGSLSVLSPDGGVPLTRSAPLARDAAGKYVDSFWFQDGEQLVLNVDHYPGSTVYPLIVDVTLH
jgi:hypothetical protein